MSIEILHSSTPPAPCKFPPPPRPRKKSATERQDEKYESRFWKQKISWWTHSSYEDKREGLLLHWLAQRRRPLHARTVVALHLLSPHLLGKTVLDIGCGNGHFLKACLDLGAVRVIGIDISSQAVELAGRLAEQNGYGDRATFMVGKASSSSLPKADFVTGPRLLDWLDPMECMMLFRNVQRRQFLFGYEEEHNSLSSWLHPFHLLDRPRRSDGGRCAQRHTHTMMMNRLKKAGIKKIHLVHRKEMRLGRLLHNLPDVPTGAPRAHTL